MRCPALLLSLALAACTQAPDIAWPGGPAPVTQDLLPADQLAPPAASADPGPALAARAAALRQSLGL